jgi:uncharacterized protein (TIRG00374 family)
MQTNKLMVLKKIFNLIVKVFLPLIVGCLLLWLLYKNIDFSRVWEVLQHNINYKVLLLSLVFGLVANIIRAFRWGLLIDALGERCKVRNLIYAVLGNYALNYVLPRAGEVWRCGIITKYEHIPFTKLFGTLLIDRVTDTLSVGTLTLFIFAFNLNFFETFFSHHPELAITNIGGSSIKMWLLVVILILAGALWFVFVRLGHLTLVQKAKLAALNIWEGMKSVWRMERKVLFIVQTVMIWGLYFLFFYTTFYAFDFTKDLGVGIGLIAFTMSSIGVAVPIQGGIGPWHFMVISTLVCFNVSADDAAAFALVVHTLQSAWQALCGLFGIVALPIANKSDDVEVPA